jgi:hypothetical protein
MNMVECMKMKKILLVALTLMLAFSLCACDSGGQTAISNDSTSSPAQTESPSQPSTNAAAEQDESGEGRGDLITDGEGRGDIVGDAFTLTLYADLSGGSAEENIQTEDISLPLEDAPASPSLTAFALADGLSEWTGLDFTLNDVTLGEDSVTVDWSAEATFIAGLGDREQKAEFHFYDAVSLNWFMMDSLAQTLKNNLDVSVVYYSSDGGPVTFTNPEDMAAQGLPELPVDQPYESSAFFVTHAGAQG